MTKFSDLDLNPKVLKAVEEAGYESPTPIQADAIPHALAGRDVLGIAQTGTGKTASFTLPMITALARGRARARMPRSLVLCPTRELAAQVAENFDTYSKYVKLTKALLIGGVSFKEQDLAIDKGVDVLIATPGRLLDHFERVHSFPTDVPICRERCIQSISLRMRQQTQRSQKLIYKNHCCPTKGQMTRRRKIRIQMLLHQPEIQILQ